jgi:hypothetical protein
MNSLVINGALELALLLRHGWSAYDACRGFASYEGPTRSEQRRQDLAFLEAAFRAGMLLADANTHFRPRA